MSRYRLRTLLILLAIGPPMIWLWRMYEEASWRNRYDLWGDFYGGAAIFGGLFVGLLIALIFIWTVRVDSQ